MVVASPRGAVPRPVAHIAVIDSEPPPNARVSQPIGDVRVTFDGPLADASTVTVVDSGFQRVDEGPSRIENGSTIAVGVEPRALGWLTVQYDAVGADGHLATGSYAIEAVPSGAFSGTVPLAAIAVTLLLAVLGARLLARRRTVAAPALLVLISAFVAACGQNAVATPRTEPTVSAAPPVASGTEPAAVASTVSVILAASDLATGPSRFAFALLNENGAVVEGAEVGITFFRLEGETAIPDSEGEAVYYPGAVESSGLYVVRTEFDVAGLWGAEVRPRLAAGPTLPSQRVRFQVADSPRSPAVGRRPPATNNSTVDPASATAAELAAITSDPEPDPDLYALTVDEAAASGRPSVVVFATPGYCQTEICKPVLDEVKQVKMEWAGKVNFVHVEVYGSFDPLELSPLMDTWGLTTEPWVFVMDKDGVITDRLEGNVTAAELGPIVAAIAGGAS